jgi:hypothetical protein
MTIVDIMIREAGIATAYFLNTHLFLASDP